MLDQKPTWYIVAEKELGVTESSSSGAKRIIEYDSTTTLHARDPKTPWCSSFVNWCFQQVGIKGTLSAAADSWKHWGVSFAKAKLGAVIVFTWANGTHHVTFFDHEDKDGVWCFGGNQHDSVKLSCYDKKFISAIRWPKLEH